MQLKNKKCEFCNIIFDDNSKYQNMRYCSKKCQQKAWKANNIDRVKKNQQDYHQQYKDKINKRVKEWRKQNINQSNIHRYKYKKTHKLSIKEKIKHALRTRINDVLNGRIKGGSAIKDLGCSIAKLKIYLQLKFHRNPRGKHEYMTWDNHGLNGWHIDHIKPLASFDLTNPEEFKKACHYTNLQPMWAKDNLRKSNK